MTREQTYYEKIRCDLGCAKAELTADAYEVLRTRVHGLTAHVSEMPQQADAEWAAKVKADQLNSKG